MNSQTNTKQRNARPNKKTAESAQNISAKKRNQNIYNDVPEKFALTVHVSRD